MRFLIGWVLSFLDNFFVFLKINKVLILGFEGFLVIGVGLGVGGVLCGFGLGFGLGLGVGLGGGGGGGVCFLGVGGVFFMVLGILMILGGVYFFIGGLIVGLFVIFKLGFCFILVV